ncbi:MAG: hypothetical protein WDW38_005016 [Sanguina aurantia]
MSSNRSGPSGGYSSPPEMDSNFVITLDDVVPAVHDNQNFNQQQAPAYNQAPQYNNQAPAYNQAPGVGSGPQRSDAPAFAPSGSGQPFTGGGAAGGSSGSSPSAKTYEQVEEESAKLAFYNIRRYRPYFNLDTKDAVWRATSSLFGPFRPTFMADTMARPDLYGPFWIATTLIFVTAVAGNFASYIAFVQEQHSVASPPPLSPGGFAPPSPPSSSQAQWYNDYGKMSASAAVFYGYVFLVGMALYFILRYFKGDMKLVNVWCIYGYSLTIFIPISLVCVVPIETVRWCAVATATLMSGLFLFMNLRAVIYAAAPARATIMLIVILLLHLALGVGLKLYFFSY